MTTWPTLAPPSPNSFVDHFPGSSVDSTKWTTVVSGSASVAVSDSNVTFTGAANSAGFLYYNAQLDKTKSQLWLMCASVSAMDGRMRPMMLLNGASAPVADTVTNINAKQIYAATVNTQSVNCVFDNYVDNSGSQFGWNQGTPAWGTLGSTSQSIAPARVSDYYVYGMEIDAVNLRWRALKWGQSFTTAGTFTSNISAPQGWMLVSVTDWVTWAATRDSASGLWLAMGKAITNDTTVNNFSVEWIKYVEAPAGNQVYDGWLASHSDVGTDPNAHIRHVYSYDGRTFLPQDRTTKALQAGAGGTYDAGQTGEPWVVYDGASTDWMFYTATDGSNVRSIAVASATHLNNQTNSWTKYGSNPLFTVGSSGANDDSACAFPFVVCDQSEQDPNKQWKCLYSAKKVSDGKWRTMYATAPAATGSWTKQGTVLDVGAGGAGDEKEARYAIAIQYGGQWEVWYTGTDANGLSRLMRATGTDLGTLTKDGVASYYTPSITATDQALTANLNTAPGRTVTVADTSNYQVDGMVVLSQSTNSDTWSGSRIRKIVSGTVLELYHGVTGFLTTYPARVKQIDSAPNVIPRQIVRVGAEWWFYMGWWEPFVNTAEAATYSSVYEEVWLHKHSNAAPSGANATPDYFHSPVASRSVYGGQESFENITLVNSPLPAATPAVLPSVPVIYLRQNR